MQHNNILDIKAVAFTAKRDGVLDFKDEGENETGLAIGKLTLRSSAEPVYADDRWVTKPQALSIAAAWGVDLFEY